jgi:hypothetical protein
MTPIRYIGLNLLYSALVVCKITYPFLVVTASAEVAAREPKPSFSAAGPLVDENNTRVWAEGPSIVLAAYRA